MGVIWSFIIQDAQVGHQVHFNTFSQHGTVRATTVIALYYIDIYLK